MILLPTMTEIMDESGFPIGQVGPEIKPALPIDNGDD